MAPDLPKQPSAHGKPHLLALPQELQDDIFVLAFSCSDELKILPTTREVKVQDFLVSKAFFVNAARAYIEERLVSFQTMDYVSCYNGIKVFFRAGIGGAWTRKLHYELTGSSTAVQLPRSLRTLHLIVPSWLFVQHTLRKPWKRELHDADIEEALLASPEKILDVRNLKEFSMSATKPIPLLGSSAEEQATWNRNLQRIESIIRSKVLLSEPTSPSGSMLASGHTPLYPGSLVSATSSRLLQDTPQSLLFGGLSITSPIAPRRGPTLPEATPPSSLFRRPTSASTTPRTDTPTARQLAIDDMPETFDEFLKLLVNNQSEVMEWVRKANESMRESMCHQ